MISQLFFPFLAMIVMFAFGFFANAIITSDKEDLRVTQLYLMAFSFGMVSVVFSILLIGVLVSGGLLYFPYFYTFFTIFLGLIYFRRRMISRDSLVIGASVRHLAKSFVRCLLRPSCCFIIGFLVLIGLAVFKTPLYDVDSLSKYLQDAMVFVREGGIVKEDSYMIGTEVFPFISGSLMYAYLFLFGTEVSYARVMVFPFLLGIVAVTREIYLEFYGDNDGLSLISGFVSLVLPLTVFIGSTFPTYMDVPRVFFLWGAFLFLVRAIRYFSFRDGFLASCFLGILSLLKITGLFLSIIVVIVGVMIFLPRIERLVLSILLSTIFLVIFLFGHNKTGGDYILAWVFYSVLFCIFSVYSKHVEIVLNSKKPCSFSSILFIVLPQLIVLGWYVDFVLKWFRSEPFYLRLNRVVDFVRLGRLFLVIVVGLVFSFLLFLMLRLTIDAYFLNISRKDVLYSRFSSFLFYFRYKLVKIRDIRRIVLPVLGLLLVVFDFVVVFRYWEGLPSGMGLWDFITSFENYDEYLEFVRVFPLGGVNYFLFGAAFGSVFLFPKVVAVFREFREKFMFPLAWLVLMLMIWVFAEKMICLRYVTIAIVPASIIITQGLGEICGKIFGAWEKSDKSIFGPFVGLTFFVSVIFLFLNYDIIYEGLAIKYPGLVDYFVSTGEPIRHSHRWFSFYLSCLFVLFLVFLRVVFEVWSRIFVKRFGFSINFKSPKFNLVSSVFVGVIIVSLCVPLVMPHGLYANPKYEAKDWHSNYYDVIDLMGEVSSPGDTVVAYLDYGLSTYFDLRVIDLAKSSLRDDFLTSDVGRIADLIRAYDVDFVVVPLFFNTFFNDFYSFMQRSGLFQVLGDPSLFELVGVSRNWGWAVYEVSERWKDLDGYVGLGGINLEGFPFSLYIQQIGIGDVYLPVINSSWLRFNISVVSSFAVPVNVSIVVYGQDSFQFENFTEVEQKPFLSVFNFSVSGYGRVYFDTVPWEIEEGTGSDFKYFLRRVDRVELSYSMDGEGWVTQVYEPAVRLWLRYVYGSGEWWIVDGSSGIARIE